MRSDLRVGQCRETSCDIVLFIANRNNYGEQRLLLGGTLKVLEYLGHERFRLSDPKRRLVFGFAPSHLTALRKDADIFGT